jgi:hypothetical protein
MRREVTLCWRLKRGARGWPSPNATILLTYVPLKDPFKLGKSENACGAQWAHWSGLGGWDKMAKWS